MQKDGTYGQEKHFQDEAHRHAEVLKRTRRAHPMLIQPPALHYRKSQRHRSDALNTPTNCQTQFTDPSQLNPITRRKEKKTNENRSRRKLIYICCKHDGVDVIICFFYLSVFCFMTANSSWSEPKHQSAFAGFHTHGLGTRGLPTISSRGQPTCRQHRQSSLSSWPHQAAQQWPSCGRSKQRT